MRLGVDCINRIFIEIFEMGYGIIFLIFCFFGFKCLYNKMVYMKLEIMERGERI